MLLQRKLAGRPTAGAGVSVEALATYHELDMQPDAAEAASLARTASKGYARGPLTRNHQKGRRTYAPSFLSPNERRSDP